MWVLFAIFSALCLGFYDVSKKQSLVANSISGVLLLSVLCSSFLLLPFWLLSRLGAIPVEACFYVPLVDANTHLFIILKSVIVLSSWFLAYIAVKHLPLTIVAPLNATRPMWTLLGAVLIFGESLNTWQLTGICVVLVAFFAFSLAGRKEGVHFAHNRYIFCLLSAVLLGAASGLYDKYLMRNIDHNAVQVYYTFYQVLLMLPLYLLLRPSKNISKPLCEKSPLKWTWWIAGISLFLVLSDFFYFMSLTFDDSLIAVVSTTRRCGVIIPFLYGAVFLHDKNVLHKAVCLCFVILGMICLLFGTM